MTKKKILNLILLWQRVLGLEHWEILVTFDEDAGENADARIWRSESYDKALIFLEPDWKNWDMPKANRMIAHELLHLVTRDLEVAFDSVDAVVSNEAFAVLSDRFEHELEGVVDRLAGSLVDLSLS